MQDLNHVLMSKLPSPDEFLKAEANKSISERLKENSSFKAGLDKFKKIAGTALVGTAVATTLFSATADARQIGQFTTFAVPVSNLASGERQVPGWLTKAVTGRHAVVNLTGNATNSPNHVSTMRNSNRAFRGSTVVRRGERRTFATPGAQAGFSYALWMRATNVANSQIRAVAVTGSWSPDER